MGTPAHTPLPLEHLPVAFEELQIPAVAQGSHSRLAEVVDEHILGTDELVAKRLHPIAEVIVLEGSQSKLLPFKKRDPPNDQQT
jgi:hypothetical protein